MSALDLITMTHSQDCNAYFILGGRCRCGATQAARELAAMRARLAALEAVAEVVKDVCNSLPDSEIELAREAWGNTNTAIVKSQMARLKLAITQLHIARKAQE